MQTIPDSRTDHTDELREEIFGDGPMIENQFAIQYENYCNDHGVGNGYENVHGFKDTLEYTSNLEKEIKKFKIMLKAKINPTTTMLENVISNVVEIKDQCVVGTLDDMDVDLFDASSSFDSIFGQFDENLDNMDNLNFDAMANLFEEPF